jgi:hypothetical protein
MRPSKNGSQQGAATPQMLSTDQTPAPKLTQPGVPGLAGCMCVAARPAPESGCIPHDPRPPKYTHTQPPNAINMLRPDGKHTTPVSGAKHVAHPTLARASPPYRALLCITNNVFIVLPLNTRSNSCMSRHRAASPWRSCCSCCICWWAHAAPARAGIKPRPPWCTVPANSSCMQVQARLGARQQPLLTPTVRSTLPPPPAATRHCRWAPLVAFARARQQVGTPQMQHCLRCGGSLHTLHWTGVPLCLLAADKHNACWLGIRIARRRNSVEYLPGQNSIMPHSTSKAANRRRGQRADAGGSRCSPTTALPGVHVSAAPSPCSQGAAAALPPCV